MNSKYDDITNPSVIVPADCCDDLYFKLFNSLYDGLGLFELCNNKIRAIYLNEQYFVNVGYTKEQYLPYYDNVTVTLMEEDEKRILENIGVRFEQKEMFQCEVRGYNADGRVVWYSIRGVPVDFVKSEYPVMLISVNDITVQQEAVNELNINKELYRILEETSSAFLFEYNHFTDTMTFLHSQTKERLEIASYSMYLRRSDQLHPEDASYFFCRLSEACRKECKSYIDVRSHNADKTDYTCCRIYYSSIADELGTIISVVGRIEDITGKTGYNAKFTANQSVDICGSIEAKADALDIISESIKKEGIKCFLIVADIDNFTQFNEKYGKHVADDALCLCAELISDIFKGAVIFRYTGDEFAIFAEDITENVLQDMFDKLTAAAETICLENGDTVSLSFSAGAAWTVNNSRVSFNDYLITAEKALFKAKMHGKNRMYTEKITY